jgi:hypothetical protein
VLCEADTNAVKIAGMATNEMNVSSILMEDEGVLPLSLAH